MMGMREWRRVGAWLRSEEEIGRDVDDEVEFHLQMRTERLVRSGLSHAAAAEQAQREFGDAAGLRSDLRRRDGRRERRRRTGMWWDDLRQDVRFALRSFRRAPGFTAVAAGTLVLGIGASAAMFTVVNGVLLRPLPYAQPDRLVHVWPGHNMNIALAHAVGGGAPSLESWTGIAVFGLTLTGQGDAVQLTTQVVDAGFFDVVGVRPQLGRGFRVDESDPARADVVILSHDLWVSRFGGDASIIGRRIDVDGYVHSTREVIGVMPRGFVPPLYGGADRVDLWVPLSVPPGRTVATDSTWYVNNVIGRLRPGATVAGLAAEVGTQLERIRAESGSIMGEDAIRTAGAAGLLDSMVGDTRGTLWMLLGAVGLVLLLACANLVNLLLARGERRRAELAARAALGGTRARLIRELVTESAVLAAAGAAGGVLLARLILGVLGVVDSSGLPRVRELSVDARVIAFAAVVAAGSLLLFALLPALRMTGDLRPDLGAGRRTHGSTRAGRRLGAVLTGGEVALAMVLVTAAALLIQSFRTVRGIDPGMDTADVLAVRIAPPPAEYTSERARLLYDDLLDRLRALPGVRSVGAIHLLPFTQNNWRFPYLADGHEPPSGAPLPSANFRVISADYFEAVDVPLLAGRPFDTRDVADGAAVGIINRTLAEQLWPGQDAVGRDIKLFGNMPFRVIGVVGDVHQHALDTRPEPEMYRPLGQWPLASMVVMIETDHDPAASATAVRQVVAGIDPRIPVVEARPLADVLGDSIAQRRFFAGVLTCFGLLALALGGIGVYGVSAYAVNARVPEFSLRMALGATPRQVLSDALRTGLVPVMIGMGVGTAAALVATRLLESLLFDIRPHDPVVLALSATLLGFVALLAIWLPARRARRVQPMEVLNAGRLVQRRRGTSLPGIYQSDRRTAELQRLRDGAGSFVQLARESTCATQGENGERDRVAADHVGAGQLFGVRFLLAVLDGEQRHDVCKGAIDGHDNGTGYYDEPVVRAVLGEGIGKQLTVWRSAKGGVLDHARSRPSLLRFSV